MVSLYDLSPGEAINTLPALDAVITPALADVAPAVAVTAARDGEVLVNAAWGDATPTTRFDLASVTKIFTTVTLLSLLAEHDIDLHTPIAEIVPEFAASGPRPIDGGQDPHTKEPLPDPPGSAGVQVDPRRVTLFHLLTHTSGLAPWRDVFNRAGPPPAPPDQPDPVRRETRWSRALAAICEYPFVAEPDGVIRYSDLGLMLLGEAASRLHGTPGDLAAAVQARVLAPLELTTVTFNPVRGGLPRAMVAPTEIDATWRQRRVWGEVHDENACGVGGVAGHAGLFSTARDVALLGQAWLDRDARLRIPPARMAEAEREHARTDDTRRGLGWVLKAVNGAFSGPRYSERSFGHTGFTGTTLWIDPDTRLVVACLTNSVYYGRLTPDITGLRRAIHDTIARVSA